MTERDLEPLEARVRSYLRSRADAPVPRNVLNAALERRARLQVPWYRRLSSVVGLASAAAVLVAAVLASLALGPPPSSLSTPLPSGLASADATLSPYPAASDGTFPQTVLGMPVVTVAEAVDLLAAGRLDGRAVAVGGYWLDSMIPSCPAPRRFTAPLESYCYFQYFASEYVELTHCDHNPGGSGGCSSTTPPRPFLEPVVLAEASGMDAIYNVGSQDPQAGESARQMVVIGHSNDPRLWECEPDVREKCARAFVVDRVAWLAGKPVEVSPAVSYSEPTLFPALGDIAGASGLGDAMLNAVAVRATEVSTIDPRFHDVGDGPVWVARSIRRASDASEDHTAAVDVALIDDTTGEIRDSTGLELDPTFKPSRLSVQASGMHTRSNSDIHPFYRVERMDGGVIWQAMIGSWTSSDGPRTLYGSGQPAVLDPDRYVLRAWRATSRRGEIGEPTDDCSSEIRLAPSEDVVLQVSFPRAGPCSIGPPTFTMFE